MDNDSPHIILFDGVCNLCGKLVQFIIKRDPLAKFRFASLQSETGQKLLKHFQLKTDAINTFVYICGGSYYLKSEAVLRVLKELKGGWKYGYICMVLPRFFRDFIYNLTARSRYRIFGKQDSCMVPSPGIRDRFLEW